jgi:phosphoribosylformimino-5-aminoimidazole carboxamide ribotide isomerase
MFRPCIDLRGGKVVQIVGGTLTDAGTDTVTRFESDRPASWFAQRYRDDGLLGGHVILLGPGNDQAARDALTAYPGGLHVGGGIHADNARSWLDAGASHVIVTSWIFRDGQLDPSRLAELVRAIGRQRLVLDLSCRRRGDTYLVVTNRWQTFTQLEVSPNTLQHLAQSCAEFLVHAVDQEGLCLGIDPHLVELLADASPIPVTYAGGARSLQDLEDVQRLGQGRIDLTIGSALDLFGGTGVRYQDCLTFNRQHSQKAP